MTDLREKLLKSQAEGSFTEHFVDLESKIVKLQSQNDALQSNCDTEIYQREFQRQLLLQKEEMDEQIKDLKDHIGQLDKIKLAVDNKNKVRRLKEMFAKESKRNTAIFQQILFRTSFGSVTKIDDPTTSDNIITPVNTIEINIETMQPVYQKDSDSLNHRTQMYPNPEKDNRKQLQYKKEEEKDSYLQTEVQFNIDQVHENILIKQNQDDLDEIEQEAAIINKCMKDISQEVSKQDQGLDIVETNQDNTKKNIQETQNQLEKANDISQGGKKWYYILLIIVLVACVVTLVLYLNHIYKFF